MTGRWQCDGTPVGTPGEPVVKHRDGIPWHRAPRPWPPHLWCSPQTVELVWARTREDWAFTGLDLPAAVRLFCACGAVNDLTAEHGWVGRNSRGIPRSVAPAPRVARPLTSSVRARRIGVAG